MNCDLSTKNDLPPAPQIYQPETIDKTFSNKGMVILQPVAMRIPNPHNVYSLSKLRLQKTVTYNEFLSHYANHPQGIRICFDDELNSTTIFEKSKMITAYGFGLDCWYIVVNYCDI